MKIKENIVSLDFLRGLTVIFMILFHFFIEWMYWTPRNYGMFQVIIFFFGYLAAPFFLIISGMGYHFFINKKINVDISKLSIFSEIIKRALFIFGVSTFLHLISEYILFKELSNIIYWSVFQVIAFSMILFFLIPFLKQNLRIFFYISLIILFFFIDFIISYYNLKFLSILDEGIFAFIPWTSFYIFGLFFGDLISSWFKKKNRKKLIIIIAIGIISILTLFIWILYTSYSYYHNRHFFVLFILMCGIFLILFSFFYYYFDINSKQCPFQKSIIRYGKLAFSIYYIHFGVITLGILIFPLIINEIYSSGFLIYQYIIFIIIFIISLEAFIQMWKRYNYFLGIEWLLNKISKKTLFLTKYGKNMQNPTFKE